MKAAWMIAGVLAFTHGAWAQTSKLPVPSKSREDAASALAEATRVLERARANGQTEAQRRAREQATDSRRAENLLYQAETETPKGSSPEEVARQTNADSRLNRAISTISPEGKALLAQSESVIPTLRVPDPVPVRPAPATSTKPSVLTAVGPGPKPTPIKPTPLTPVAKKEPDKTIINATGPDSASYFDGSKAMGVFTGDVEVTHPQFHLTCDTLEVYMIKEGEVKKDEKPAAAAVPLTASQLAAQDAAGTGKPGAAAPAAKEGQANSNIKQAIAKGRKVVINKLSETGEVQIGTCRHATFVGATGDMIMRDFPQVQKGTNLILATDASTVITILNNGQLKTQGPTTTKIIQEGEAKKGSGAGPAPATTT
ncbi:MAG: hypothetical protein ACAI34_00585, partial [Verrucomicrobium sp.]